MTPDRTDRPGCSPVRTKDRSHISTRDRSKVGTQIGTQVGTQTGTQTGTQLGTQVGTQVRMQVRSQVRRRAGSSRLLDRDTGSGTVLVLTASAVLLLAGLLLTSLAAVGVARHRAASVADLSALAAAASAHLGSGSACEAARDVAARSAARLVECQVTGDVAEVVAGVRPPGRLGELGEALARARAGPARSGSAGA